MTNPSKKRRPLAEELINEDKNIGPYKEVVGEPNDVVANEFGEEIQCSKKKVTIREEGRQI